MPAIQYTVPFRPGAVSSLCASLRRSGCCSSFCRTTLFSFCFELYLPGGVYVFVVALGRLFVHLGCDEVAQFGVVADESAASCRMFRDEARVQLGHFA